MQSLKLKLTLLYSEMTKNPSKVVNVNFHRVIHLPDNQEQSQLTDNQIPQIVLFESPIYDRMRATGEKLLSMMGSSIKT